jgi:hypothetical protein
MELGKAAYSLRAIPYEFAPISVDNLRTTSLWVTSGIIRESPTEYNAPMGKLVC